MSGVRRCVYPRSLSTMTLFLFDIRNRHTIVTQVEVVPTAGSVWSELTLWPTSIELRE